jgi:cell division protease FtsH
MAHPRTHSEETAGEIDTEVKAIVDSCYRKAKELISQHRDIVIKCAEELLVKEKLTRDEFEALFEG